MGIMAQHLRQGSDFPVFFYGQAYGFSLFETLPIALFSSFVADPELAVHLGVLSLWLCGLAFFYLSLKSFTNYKSAFMGTLLLLSSPAWSLWCVMAGAVHVSAFFLSSVILFLSSSKKQNRLRAFFIGLLCVFIYQTQPLWLAGTLPFILFWLMNNSHLLRHKLFWSFLGLTLTASAFYLAKLNTSNFWAPPIFTSDVELMLKNLMELPYNTYKSLTGTYLYMDWHDLSPFANGIALAYTTFSCCTLIVVAYLLLKKNKLKSNLLLFAALAVLATCSYVIILRGFVPRYLVPLQSFLLIFLAIGLKDHFNKPLVIIVALCFFVSGTIATITNSNFQYEWHNKQDIRNFIAKMEADKKEIAYCTNGLLQWQISFYSKGKIIARFYYDKDRYMPFMKQIKETCIKYPEKAAIIGFRYNIQDDYDLNKTQIIGPYFYMANVTDTLIKKIGFEF